MSNHKHRDTLTEEQRKEIKSRVEKQTLGFAVVVFIVLAFFAFRTGAKEQFVESMDGGCYSHIEFILANENRSAHEFQVEDVYDHGADSYTVVGDLVSYTPSLDLYHTWYFACDIDKDDEGNQDYSNVEVTVESSRHQKYLESHIPKNSKTL